MDGRQKGTAMYHRLTPFFATLTSLFATLTPCGRPNQTRRSFNFVAEPNVQACLKCKKYCTN